jgi:C4-dicarboxylate transporter DctM subunit
VIAVAGVLLVAFVVLGTPIAFAMVAAAFLGYAPWGTSFATTAAQRFYAGLDTFTLLSIPFFITAGLIMEASGISRRLVSFATAVIGWMTGSLLLVATLTATILGAISGSGTADTAAVSAALQPEMKRRNYDPGFSAALIASAGTLAAIIPPSLIMIVLAMVTNLSIGKLFLGGVAPGLLASAMLLGSAMLFARTDPETYKATTTFSLRTLGKETVGALPALLMPAIIIGGILGGIFTATEAAAVACFYGFLVGVFVHRELTRAAFYDLLSRAAGYSAAVMFIVGAANILGWLVATEGLPAKISEALQSITNSPMTFLLIVNIMLLFVGMFIEAAAALLILAPIIFPIAVSYGVDPIHFGIIVTLNLAIGLVTPPFGLNLYVSALASEVSLAKIVKKMPLPLLALLVTLGITTAFPAFVLYLPNLVYR